MATTARGRWMADIAAISLGNEDLTSEVEDAFRESANSKKLSDFLDGKTEEKHIFVFYQIPDIINEIGEPVDGQGKAKIHINFGDTDRIKAKAVYFIRAGGKVNTDVATDDSLLFGELDGKKPLECLGGGLRNVFTPLINNVIIFFKHDKRGLK